MKKILTVCLNPTFQKTMVFDSFHEGEVNRCKIHRLDASGKGINVSRIITQLGGSVIHLTHLGGSRKEEMLSLLASDSIETAWVETSSSIRTCTTIIHTAARSTTELVEEPETVDAQTDAKMRALYSSLLPHIETVVFSGTRAKGYSEHLYSDMVKEAKSLGKLVILDVKGKDLTESLPWGVDLIKPNLSEFASTFLSNTTVLEQDNREEMRSEVETQLRSLYEKYHTVSVLTRGSHNVWLYGKEGFATLPVKKAQPINTIGCGDAVTAGIAYALTNGKTLIQAVATGLQCGYENAIRLKPGTLVD